MPEMQPFCLQTYVRAEADDIGGALTRTAEGRAEWGLAVVWQRVREPLGARRREPCSGTVASTVCAVDENSLTLELSGLIGGAVVHERVVLVKQSGRWHLELPPQAYCLNSP
jgi:hypothetical protein